MVGYNVVNTIFISICACIATYMSLNQALKYFENNDSSSINLKDFDISLETQDYPVVTLCWEDKMDLAPKLYDSEYLRSNFNISSEKYLEFLLGLQKTHQESDQPFENTTSIMSLPTNFYSIDIRNASSIKFKDIVKEASFVYFNDSYEFSTTYTKNNETMPFYLSYQDPLRICYSRDQQMQPNFFRKNDLVWIEKYRFGNKKDYINQLNLKVYIHQKGQLFRGFDRIVFQRPKCNECGKVNRRFGRSPHVTVSIAALTVLRKRPDAKEPCNPHLDHEDHLVRLRIMEKIGCIPTYWKAFHVNDTTLGDCNKPEELKGIMSNVQKLRFWYNDHDPPCSEMTVIFNVLNDAMSGHSGKKYGPKIEVHYLDQKYKEIISFRDFDIEMLWSSVGGLIGMFLGFSLSQTPELILRCLKICRKGELTFSTNES